MWKLSYNVEPMTEVQFQGPLVSFSYREEMRSGCAGDGGFQQFSPQTFTLFAGMNRDPGDVSNVFVPAGEYKTFDRIPRNPASTGA